MCCILFSFKSLTLVFIGILEILMLILKLHIALFTVISLREFYTDILIVLNIVEARNSQILGDIVKCCKDERK